MAIIHEEPAQEPQLVGRDSFVWPQRPAPEKKPREPARCSLRCASRPRTMTHRSPSPGESFCADLRDERSLAPPRLGIRSTGTIRETAALKRPRASSRSHRHHSAQSSVPAVPTANQIRAYWWCSPPRIGRQRMRPTVSAGRDIGASLCNDKWVRVPLYNTTTERPRDRGVRTALPVAPLGRMPGPYS
jgi:hypothetical protein